MRPLNVCRSSTRRRRRAGTTLPELLIALVLLGIVSATMVRALDRQARFHDGMIRLLEGRSEQSATHDAVAAEVRGTSTAAGELESVTDSSLTFRSHVGSAIVCDTGAAALVVAAEQLAGGQQLTRVMFAPLPGDTAWLLDEGPTAGSSDDRWLGAPVTTITRLTGACVGSVYVHPILDAARQGWRLTVGGLPPFPPGIGPGTPIRLTRRARLALYRTSSGDYALGYADWNAAAGGWNTIQPVSGAFAAFNRSAPASSGVVFQALDSAGVVIASGTPFPAAARLSLVTRAVTRGVIRIDGLGPGMRVDSLRSSIALRNRP